MAPTGPDTTNPYLAARYGQNERSLSLSHGIPTWQRVTRGRMKANVGLTGGLVSVRRPRMALDDVGSASDRE